VTTALLPNRERFAGGGAGADCGALAGGWPPCGTVELPTRTTAELAALSILRDAGAVCPIPLGRVPPIAGRGPPWLVLHPGSLRIGSATASTGPLNCIGLSTGKRPHSPFSARLAPSRPVDLRLDRFLVWRYSPHIGTHGDLGLLKIGPKIDQASSVKTSILECRPWLGRLVVVRVTASRRWDSFRIGPCPPAPPSRPPWEGRCCPNPAGVPSLVRQGPAAPARCQTSSR